MMKDAGVDIVTNMENLPFDDNYFDLVLCLETLEHTQKPWIVDIKQGINEIKFKQDFPFFDNL